MIDVVIPVYRPGKEFQGLLGRLMKQTVEVSHIWLLQTIGQPGEAVMQAQDDRITVIPVMQSEFDHGGTRDLGAHQSQSEYILFMTQDAMPADTHLLEQLLQGMEDPLTGIVYARQLARPAAGILERMTRIYNYPAESVVKTGADRDRMGIKTYFCSDVCALYRRSYYEELGGFVKPAIFNEDMIMAYRMIEAGYQVAYRAEAQVIHSHDYTCMQQFHRNFDLGVSQKQYEEIFASISSEKEGAGYAKKIIVWLIKQGHVLLAVYFMLQCGFKLSGYKLGLHYNKLPGWLLMKCTGSPWYWKCREDGWNGSDTD